MADANKQQISQPILTDMNPIARSIATCVVQNVDDNCPVAAEDGDHLTVNVGELDDNAGSNDGYLHCLRRVPTVST